MNGETPARSESGSRALPEALLVSVLLLTYRHEKFLAEAIQGVLSQTYSPLEIILLDDASPDATPQVIATELARHPRGSDVRVIRNPQNLGFRDNTVRGLAEARGEFVVRLAGDDIAGSELIARMVALWRAENVSLITVNAEYIDAVSQPLGRFHRDPAGPHDDSFETLARDGVNDLCFGPVIAFERALYDEFGWSPAYLQASDIMMPFYAYLAKGARFIGEPLIKYRAHGGNMSLSVAFERGAGAIDRALVEEQIQYSHLAHALLMEKELNRLQRANPKRFRDIAQRIAPLLAIQKSERTRKLVASRIELHKLGVTAARAKYTAQSIAV
jgi:glycosyltransferase involved in cell wall biosynthesis